MIITKLMGGNGNQMFQYAAGLALAKARNVDLLLDINYLLDKSKRYFRHENRNYALEMFNISASIATNKEISKYTVPRIGNKYLYHIRKRLVREYNVFREVKIYSIEDFLVLPANSYLDGYWQKFRYVELVSNELIESFSFKRRIPQHCFSIYKKIKSKTSICIIFRRGDYVNHPYLDIIGLDYYHKCIKIFIEKLNSPFFFIFSDDISWVRENFKPGGCSYLFVDQEFTGPNAEYYLQLISSCDHFIIPNSTFAWWGAWLGKNPNKIVIAPKKWHKSQIEEKNAILPQEWISL